MIRRVYQLYRIRTLNLLCPRTAQDGNVVMLTKSSSLAAFRCYRAMKLIEFISNFQFLFAAIYMIYYICFDIIAESAITLYEILIASPIYSHTKLTYWSGAYIIYASANKIILLQIIACRLFGTKPLSEPMLELGTSVSKTLTEIQTSKKMHLKMPWYRDGGHLSRPRCVNNFIYANSSYRNGNYCQFLHPSDRTSICWQQNEDKSSAPVRSDGNEKFPYWGLSRETRSLVGEFCQERWLSGIVWFLLLYYIYICIMYSNMRIQ